jgi:GGDEF domain-containing protein
LIEVSARNRLILGRQFERESAAYKSLNNIVGRLGGEEFAILLEGSNLKAAVELAEHLRTRIDVDLQLRRQRMETGRKLRPTSQTRRFRAL